MPVIVFEAAEGIGEDGDCLIEGHAVGCQIRLGLPRIPLEGKSHAPNVPIGLCIRLTPQVELRADQIRASEASILRPLASSNDR